VYYSVACAIKSSSTSHIKNQTTFSCTGIGVKRLLRINFKHICQIKKKLRHIKKLIAGNANLLNKRNSVYKMMLINTEY